MTAKTKTRALSRRDQDKRQRQIAELNDQLRRYGRGGVICITAGVQALGDEDIGIVLAAVRDFDAFTPDNDPYGEHDMGFLKAAGQRIAWKIDYYDRERRFGSPDPADSAVTTRVLTIMLANEY